MKKLAIVLAVLFGFASLGFSSGAMAGWQNKVKTKMQGVNKTVNKTVKKAVSIGEPKKAPPKKAPPKKQPRDGGMR
jgi:hypothetical protein